MIKVKLGKKIVSANSLPYIIAEIGVNHECSMKKAKQLILNAKKGGADAAKFQTYKAHLITSKHAPGYWDLTEEKTKNQFELFTKFDHFEKENYYELANYCKQVGIEFISTPFDHNAVDMLDRIVKFYKVSSSDITNFPLLHKIASKKKPILISTGASSIKEIDDAIDYLKKHRSKDIVIMHCILNYPTMDKDANLNMITNLKEKYPKHIIGYSDHTLPCKEMKNLTTAYLLGARVIEKHFTLNKKLEGNDHYHSMNINDLFNFVNRLKNLKFRIGIKEKKYLNSELKSRRLARRSLVLIKSVSKNSIIKKSNLICKRPGTGIQPLKINRVIGKRVNKNLKDDHILKWSDLHSK